MRIVIEVIEDNLSDAEKMELVRQLAQDTPDAKDGGFLELTDDIGRALLVQIVGVARPLGPQRLSHEIIPLDKA